ALSLTGEVTDLAAFCAAPGEGTSLVGWLRHPAWGALPLDHGRFTVEGLPGAGRRFRFEGAVAPGVLTVAFDVPERGKLAALRSAEAQLTLASPKGEVHGLAALGPADLLRLALSFEPSGAHDLRDRLRAARATFGFLRR